MEDRNDGGMETAAASSLNHYLRTVFEAAGRPWNSTEDSEIDRRVQAIAAETIKKIEHLEQDLKAVFKSTGLPWNSDNDAEINSRIHAIVAETIKQNQLLEKASAVVDEDVIQKIRDLIKASGVQTFYEIVAEIRDNCHGVASCSDAEKKANAALKHLCEKGFLFRRMDGFGLA